MEWLLMLPWGLLAVLVLSVVFGAGRGVMADPEPFLVQFELGEAKAPIAPATSD